MTPVTFKSTLLLTVRTLPSGSSSPKYFLAISSVITNEVGERSAVLGSPLIKGKEKTSKKVESAEKTSLSSKRLSPYLTENLGRVKPGPQTGERLTALLTSAKSLTIACAIGCGVRVCGLPLCQKMR